MRGDLHDRLMDQLLREILGGDRPRDMTERVLAQARIVDRFRRRMWWSAGSALAAALAVMVGLYFLWPREVAYPGPTITDTVRVEDEAPLERGATIRTEADEGQLNLGRYVQVKMLPDTQLNLAGRPYQEKVLLSQGELDVDVTKHKGQFDIAVGQALVHVTGTKFRVRVGQEESPTTWMRKLYLAVKEGSVEVQNLPGGAGVQTVSAGEEKSFVLMRRAKAINGGGVGFAQRAAQWGARGGPISALLPGLGAAAAARNAGANARGPTQTLAPLPPATAEDRPVQMVTTPGTMVRVGRMQATGSIFYLQNMSGNFFMFERSMVAARHPEWVNLPPANQYTRVTWTAGAVSGVERYGAESGATTQSK